MHYYLVEIILLDLELFIEISTFSICYFKDKRHEMRTEKESKGCERDPDQIFSLQVVILKLILEEILLICHRLNISKKLYKESEFINLRWINYSVSNEKNLQGDSPFQDDSPVSHPRNTGANNYKGHVRPGNDKGHVRPTIPPTTPRPTPPPTPRPTPRPTRPPCPPPTTPPPPCPNQRWCLVPYYQMVIIIKYFFIILQYSYLFFLYFRTTTQAPSPCYPRVTDPPPCPYATTEHPDIAEWRRTRNRNRRPSYQSDQHQVYRYS